MPTSVEPEATYLLDTSAILAYLLNEPGGERLPALHRHSAIPFIAISELYAAIWIRFGHAKADQVIATIREWGVPWLWPTEESVFLAGRLRAIHRLGLGDSIVAALAFTHRAILVTNDTDFHVLQPELQLLALR